MEEKKEGSGMKISSTPTIEIELPFAYEGYVKKFFADFGQNGRVVVEKTEADLGYSVEVNGKKMEIYLSQEETSKFSKGGITFQLKVFTENDKVVISEQETLNAEEVLNRELFK
jgi:hypothetical protein